MFLIALRRKRHAAPARPDYMTRAEHLQEAGRLAWVADDVLQSGARRTLGDVIALARLHVDLAQHASRPDPYHPDGGRVSTPEGQ